MSDTAKITVTAGPDKGRVYDLTTEIVRLGRSPENEVAFTDSQVLEQHASIVCREGRFAIHTSVPDGLEVDGTQVPPERWVWLPEAATIRIGARTSFEFVAAAIVSAPPDVERKTASNGAGGTSRPAGSATFGGSVAIPKDKGASGKSKRGTESPSPGSDTQSRSRRSGTERGDRSKRSTVARFITDGPGDPLVKLGEDGHLPELMLHEANSSERQAAGTKESNPWILVAVLGLSMGLTMLMLFMDMGSAGNNTELKAQAREEIKEYYGKESEPRKSYQELLREARRARSRHDYEAERGAYRDVLSQLRSEANDMVARYTGLTGRKNYGESDADKKSDQRLEELINILLGE
jgi:hypothetical protein